jgi:alanyl-tRNA synthetase
MAPWPPLIAPMTEKLYWSDPMATTFAASGARLESLEGKPSVVLARTLFYPEGGGQLGDAGNLAIGPHVVRVADTQIDDAGTIHHVLAEPPPEELGSRLAADLLVRGTIDEVRRRDHMAQHTGQHALSRALLDATRAETVSARLGATTCTIDVARPGLSDADLMRAEDLVNAIVQSDVVVRAFFPTPDELAKIDLRKQPNADKAAAGVRLVSIEGFDVTPCGGTHCTRTGQIGQVRIVATEKYKGMLRITFHAGRRALDDARARHAALAAAAADLSCGALDVPGAIAKLRAEGKAARASLEAARVELAGLVARSLLEALPETPGPRVVPVLRADDDLASLRILAGKLAEDPRVVAICGAVDASGELVLVVQRGAEGKLDCGAYVMAQARARGGRGGGRPERAEGRFPRGTSVDELAESARQAL